MDIHAGMCRRICANTHSSNLFKLNANILSYFWFNPELRRFHVLQKGQRERLKIRMKISQAPWVQSHIIEMNACVWRAMVSTIDFQ